jgi:hypothetical protein
MSVTQAFIWAGIRSLFSKKLKPEPVRVADYFVLKPYCFHGHPPLYPKETHPIGQQPEGSVMVPNTERDGTR